MSSGRQRIIDEDKSALTISAVPTGSRLSRSTGPTPSPKPPALRQVDDSSSSRTTTRTVTKRTSSATDEPTATPTPTVSDADTDSDTEFDTDSLSNLTGSNGLPSSSSSNNNRKLTGPMSNIPSNRQANTPFSNNAPQDPSTDRLTPAAKAGMALGIIAFLLVLAFCITLFCIRRRRRMRLVQKRWSLSEYSATHPLSGSFVSLQGAEFGMVRHHPNGHHGGFPFKHRSEMKHIIDSPLSTSHSIPSLPSGPPPSYFETSNNNNRDQSRIPTPTPVAERKSFLEIATASVFKIPRRPVQAAAKRWSFASQLERARARMTWRDSFLTTNTSNTAPPTAIDPETPGQNNIDVSLLHPHRNTHRFTVSSLLSPMRENTRESLYPPRDSFATFTTFGGGNGVKSWSGRMSALERAKRMASGITVVGEEEIAETRKVINLKNGGGVRVIQVEEVRRKGGKGEGEGKC